MKLKVLGANQTEVQLNENLLILFSYETPVAYSQYSKELGWEWYKTANYYSRTTTKHINKWIGKAPVLVMQTQIDELVKGVRV